jgi:hypothetical protein
MTFRLHSILTTLSAMVLFAALGRAQQPPAPAGAPASAGQEAASPVPPDTTQEAPIEPVMSGPYPVMSKQAEERARQIFQMFNHGETGQMWASLSEGLRKMSGKEERFAEVNKKYHEALGPETSMRGENIVPYLLAPDTVYSRLSEFAKVHRFIEFTITVNQRGQIDAFDIKVIPERVSEGAYAGYQVTAKLKLPFNGEWLVYQGGRTPFENPYSYDDVHRYALDFAYLKNGRLFSGAGGIGSKNEDYYCFGQPVLAPFDGTVVKARTYFDDNPPGRPSPGDDPDGNIVSIRHEEGDVHETVEMDHLRQNSLKVKSGDKVKQGDVLAECGNSGAGPIPHIHFQLEKSAGTPLPAQFTDYIADGKPVASGEPVRGQFVRNATEAQTGSITTSSGKASLTTTPAAGPASTPPPAKTAH